MPLRLTGRHNSSAKVPETETFVDPLLDFTKVSPVDTYIYELCVATNDIATRARSMDIDADSSEQTTTVIDDYTDPCAAAFILIPEPALLPVPSTPIPAPGDLLPPSLPISMSSKRSSKRLATILHPSGAESSTKAHA